LLYLSNEQTAKTRSYPSQLGGSGGVLSGSADQPSRCSDSGHTIKLGYQTAGIPSKTDVINGHPAVRWGVEAVGTYVNFGKRDLPEEPTEQDYELFDLAKASNKRLNTDKMRTVDIFGIYIEGTRGSDPEHVQDPMFGYANAAEPRSSRQTVTCGLGLRA
jgi:hypothetical protein